MIHCERCGEPLDTTEPMTLEYDETVDENQEPIDAERVEVIGAREEPAEPERVVAAYHVECHKVVVAERNDANEWHPG